MENTDTPPLRPAPQNGGAKVTLTIAAIAVAFAALFIAGLLPRLSQKQHLDTLEKTDAATAATVSVARAHRVAEGDLILPGSVEAIENISVGARSSGYVRRRYVDIGSRVRAGQVLAEIESPDVDQQLIQAQADAAKSRAGTGQARADVARQQAGVEQARAETARLQAGVEQARAALARTRSRLAQARANAASSQARIAQTQQAVAGRQADLLAAQAQLGISEKTLARYQELGKEGAISSQDVDQRQATRDGDQARVTAATAAIEAARSDQQAAREAYRAAQSDIEAAQSDILASQGAVTAAQAAVQSGQAGARAALANVSASQSNVAAAQATVGSSDANVRRFAVLRGFEKVTAPFDGVITARNIETGSLISASGASLDGGGAGGSTTTPHSGLFGIARTDTLRIQVSVPQTYVGAIHTGQAARVTVREFPGKVFEGVVYQRSGALDASSRTLLTEVHLKNPGNVILPGMYAQVSLGVTPGTAPAQSLRIPANTLITNAKGLQVATVVGGKVHLLPIVTGRDFGTEIEVRSGLTGDEPLITNPSDELAEGMPVQVAAKEAGKTSP